MFALEEPPNDGGDREGHRFPKFQLMGNKNGGGGLGCKVRGVGAPGREVPPGGGIWKASWTRRCGAGPRNRGQRGQGAFQAAGALKAVVWEQGRPARREHSCVARAHGRSQE